MALTHNSKLADSEPGWGGVDKTKLPRNAHADTGEADKKSTWRFPHHWVRNGSGLNDDGVFTKGDMYLHRGGLNAAWAAAQGARTGQEASSAIKAHLQRHRRALGLEKSDEMFTEELDALFADPAKRMYGKTETHRKHLSPDKAFIDCKEESPESKSGTVEGYGSVWNVVDHGGEIVRKGAFTKTIAERGGKIPLMVVHFSKGGDVMQAVGTITDLTEDDYGLKFKATWLDDELSQTVRAKVISLRKGGVKVGASIGYRVINFGFITDEASSKTLVELRELALGEMTVTLKPMLEPALVTSAKTDDERKTLLSQFAAIEEADAEKLDGEAKTQLLVEVYGSVENAESLGNALKGIAEKTLGLLASKSQDTKPKDGAPKSADTPPKSGADADGDATTKSKVDLRESRKALEKVRMESRKASLL